VLNDVHVHAGPQLSLQPFLLGTLDDLPDGEIGTLRRGTLKQGGRYPDFVSDPDRRPWARAY
jgi:hypothetical protein